MPELVGNLLLQPEMHVLRSIADIVKAHGYQMWIVGGVIRDALLGATKRLADIDLVVERDAEKIAQMIADHFGVSSKSFPDFLTAKVLGLPEIEELDFASCRTEIYAQPGSLPQVQPAGIEEDCRRRDFTVNSLYLSLENYLSVSGLNWRNQIVDHAGGLKDLDHRLIRVLHDQSFIDDPTRLFRAQRYKVKIEGSLEEHSECLFQDAVEANALGTISAQRILMEVRLGCFESKWQKVLSAFSTEKLLARTFLLESHENQLKFERMLFAVNEELTTGLRFEYLLGLIHILTPGTERENLFRKFGFGHKFFKRMKQLFDSPEGAASNELEIALSKAQAAVGLLDFKDL